MLVNCSSLSSKAGSLPGFMTSMISHRSYNQYLQVWSTSQVPTCSMVTLRETSTGDDCGGPCPRQQAWIMSWITFYFHLLWHQAFAQSFLYFLAILLYHWPNAVSCIICKGNTAWVTYLLYAGNAMLHNGSILPKFQTNVASLRLLLQGCAYMRNYYVMTHVRSKVFVKRTLWEEEVFSHSVVPASGKQTVLKDQNIW